MTNLTSKLVPSRSWVRSGLWAAVFLGATSCSSEPCAPIPCPAPGFDVNTCECSAPLLQSPANAGNGAMDLARCDPLKAERSPVILNAADVIGAGRDAEGAVYVLVDQSSQLRLFVSGAASLAEQFESGTGQGQAGSTQFWTFAYADGQGMPVTVEVQKDATGARIGVVKGPISGKGFDVGSEGEVLEPISAAAAAALPAETTQTFHVDYAGAHPDGDDLVVIAPDHATTFDGFLIFYGPPAVLVEQPGTVSVTRGLSIPSTTVIAFTLDGAPATLQYDGTGAGTLTVDGSSASLSALATDAGVPPGAAFMCLR
jgi:hypothetical protein